MDNAFLNHSFSEEIAFIAEEHLLHMMQKILLDWLT